MQLRIVHLPSLVSLICLLSFGPSVQLWSLGVTSQSADLGSFLRVQQRQDEMLGRVVAMLEGQKTLLNDQVVLLQKQLGNEQAKGEQAQSQILALKRQLEETERARGKLEYEVELLRATQQRELDRQIKNLDLRDQFDVAQVGQVFRSVDHVAQNNLEAVRRNIQLIQQEIARRKREQSSSSTVSMAMTRTRSRISTADRQHSHELRDEEAVGPHGQYSFLRLKNDGELNSLLEYYQNHQKRLEQAAQLLQKAEDGTIDRRSFWEKLGSTSDIMTIIAFVVTAPLIYYSYYAELGGGSALVLAKDLKPEDRQKLSEQALDIFSRGSYKLWQNQNWSDSLSSSIEQMSIYSVPKSQNDMFWAVMNDGMSSVYIYEPFDAFLRSHGDKGWKLFEHIMREEQYEIDHQISGRMWDDQGRVDRSKNGRFATEFQSFYHSLLEYSAEDLQSFAGLLEEWNIQQNFDHQGFAYQAMQQKIQIYRDVAAWLAQKENVLKPLDEGFDLEQIETLSAEQKIEYTIAQKLILAYSA